MSDRISKEALKQPDAFVSTSERVFQWLQKHGQLLGLAVGAAAVLAVGWTVYGYWQASAEAKAAEALYAPEADLKKAETKVRDERAKAMQDKKGKERPVDFAADYAPAVEKVKAAIKANGGTKAALVSAMNLSYFLLQQKQYPQALEVLSLTTYTPGSGDIIGGFWLMHQGLVNMENQKYDEAAKAYQSVLDSKALAAFHPEAMLKLGVAYELKGDAAKAKQTYEKIGRDFPNSEASGSAQQYMRLLELKPQQG